MTTSIPMQGAAKEEVRNNISIYTNIQIYKTEKL
jgi:hypothetical protein